MKTTSSEQAIESFLKRQRFAIAKMKEPTISYGMESGQPVPPSAQYLLLKAGIGSDVYASGEFIGMLNRVNVSDLPVSFDRCGEIFYQRREIVAKAAMQAGSIVTIENLRTDELTSLEGIMSQPFE